MRLPSEEICKKVAISTTKLHVILFSAGLRLRACMSKK
jgi:DNA-directed RNA polymerase specialized sigma24 family protein